MAGRGGSFGAARPLPGQAGYKQSETEHLEREAKDMEVRLQMLLLQAHLTAHKFS